MLRLCIQPFAGTSFEHLMEGDSVVLGRSSSCDVTLPGKCTSRRHARLYREDGAIMVEDLDSHNGTRLHGEQLTGGVPMTSGDVLEIANCFITIEEVSVPAAYVASSVSHVSSSLSGWRPVA